MTAWRRFGKRWTRCPYRRPRISHRDGSRIAPPALHSSVVPPRSTPILPGGSRRDDPRLTTDTAADFAEISEWLVREACRSGALHAWKKPNGEWSFTLPEFRRWLVDDRQYRDTDRLAYLDRLIARNSSDRPAA